MRDTPDMRPSWVEVNLDAIRANTSAIAKVVAPADLCAVVKADGYGHGDIPVAEAALAGGATWLAVALVEEAARLRDAGITVPILLLSEPALPDADDVVRLELTATVYRQSFATAIAEAADRAGRAPYPVHLKIDTGMHRVGVLVGEALTLARSIAGDGRLELAAVWSHFAVSDENAMFTDEQLRSLVSFRDQVEATGVDVPMLHIANTAGALEYPESHLDLVRVGLGIYGLRPGPTVGTAVHLEPAMRVVSQVSYHRTLPGGARPSYGRVRPLARNSTLATVPIGYADGFARRLGSGPESWPDGWEVLINGTRYPLAGNVTMDQIVIDLGMDPVRDGDEVVMLGRQGRHEITAENWAERLDTINYEIVCDFGPRLPRRYIGLPG